MSQPVDDLKCAVVVDRIEEWMDGDLPEAEAQAVEAHISGCSGCAEEFRLARSVQQGLQELPVYELPDELVEAVAAATRPGLLERMRRFFRQAVLRPVPILAATAAVAIVVVFVRPLEEPVQPVYSDQEIRQAVDDTRLALSYLGDLTRRAESGVRTKVLRERAVTSTLRGFSRSLQWSRSVAAGEPAGVETRESESKGSS